MKRALVITACLMLAACGSGRLPPTTGAAASASCVPKVVTVQLFGDSTMFGIDGRTGAQAVPSPARLLQAAMDAHFGAGAVRVTLNAVSGTDSAQLLAGTDGLNRPWPRSVKADLLVINHGLNDTDPARGIGIEKYEANLRRLVELSPVPLVLETPNAVRGTYDRYDRYAQRMREVAVSLSLPLADTNAFVKTVPNWESHFPDYLHPDAAMYALIVRNSLAPALVPLVAELRCDQREQGRNR